MNTEWLDEVAETVPATLLADGLHWVTYALETEQLMVEIEDSTDRISALVGAAKQYSQMDRAAHADIDVRDGLKSTLMMLSHKIKERGNMTALRSARYARQQLRLHVKAGFDAIARDTGRSHNPASGRQLAKRIKTAGRARRRAAR